MNNRQKGILLVFSTAVISGVAIFINQYSVKIINPYIFTGLKNIVAAGLVLVSILLLRESKQLKMLKWREWRTLIIIGLVGGSIPFLLFFKGLSLTTGAQASFIHKTMFLFVSVMAFYFLKERINKNILLGFLAILLGNVLLLKIIPNVTLGRGDLLVFIATLFWAAEQIISKKAVQDISPRVVALGRLFFGFIFIVLFWGVTGQLSLISDLTLDQLSWVWLTGLVLSGYVITWYSGLKYIPVSLATSILVLGAPITTTLQLIQERMFNLNQIAGIFLISLAVGYIVMESLRGLKKVEEMGGAKS